MHAQTVCTRLSLSPPTESLGTRLVWTSEPSARKGLGNKFDRKWLSAAVSVEEEKNVTSADQRSSSTDDKK